MGKRCEVRELRGQRILELHQRIQVGTCHLIDHDGKRRLEPTRARGEQIVRQDGDRQVGRLVQIADGATADEHDARQVTADCYCLFTRLK